MEKGGGRKKLEVLCYTVSQKGETIITANTSSTRSLHLCPTHFRRSFPQTSEPEPVTCPAARCEVAHTQLNSSVQSISSGCPAHWTCLWVWEANQESLPRLKEKSPLNSWSILDSCPQVNFVVTPENHWDSYRSTEANWVNSWPEGLRFPRMSQLRLRNFP